MNGPDIMARSLSAPTVRDRYGNLWQYHSQSDRHSKVACWAIMYDLLRNCPLLRKHAVDGKVAFGINHEMRDFETSRKKVLDLVICTPGSDAVHAPKRSFATLATAYLVQLSSSEQTMLERLPDIPVAPVGAVLLALEAKATMTAHIRALPRLHDELDSSHLTVHGHADSAIAAALVMVNIADRFIAPNQNKKAIEAASSDIVWNSDPQPRSAERTVAKVREIRRRSKPGDRGFDAMGIVMVDFRNDGSPCTISAASPAPGAGDSDNYANMVHRTASLYGSKFSHL